MTEAHDAHVSNAAQQVVESTDRAEKFGFINIKNDVILCSKIIANGE